MRKAFSYPFDETIRAQLLAYYDSQKTMDSAGGMHSASQALKTNVKLERLKPWLAISKEAELLDVGCSKGLLCTALAPQCKHITGIDLSQNIIQKNNEQNTCSNITYKCFDGVHIDQVEAFDGIFILDVLEHAFEPDALMRSIYDALKPGGRLYFQVPTTGWLSELLFGKYHMGHLRYYDDAFLKTYLPSFGYQILCLKVYNSVPLSSRVLKYPSLYRVLNTICNLVPPPVFPYFGSVVAVCEKPQ